MADHRFQFGSNWRDYARSIDADRIAAAERSLAGLLKRDRLDGLSFLDIGSGSGLFSLAALNLGARAVLAVDIDPDSVATTRDVLNRFAAPDAVWRCAELSVFDLDPVRHGTFDIVYSWGVLHHTGDLRGAIRKAAAMAAPDGILAVALYKKTPFCGLWRREKRLYSASPAPVQCFVRFLYKTAFRLRKLSLGESPSSHIRTYGSLRGMSWDHDVHDWLGGYPYESVDESDMRTIAADIGWRIIGSNIQQGGTGLLGTGCDEYVLQRSTAG